MFHVTTVTLALIITATLTALT